MSLKKPARVKNNNLLRSYRDVPCVICGSVPSEAHHIKTRGSGGDDIESNIYSLCRMHHVEVHSIGINSFTKKYGLG